MFTQDIDGDTALHNAIILKDEETSIRLINLAPTQAWLSSRNLLFQTPLHLAALTDQTHVLKHLIIAGADVTFRDKHGNTALHIACRDGLVRVVETLLTPAPNLMPQHLWDGVQYQQEPPNFGIHNYDGLTCLHLAAVNKHLNIIETLVKYDINLNMKDLKTGKTILHGSCERNDTELVSFLLRHRTCDINARTYCNSTPFDVARARSNIVICEALAAAGAKYGQQSDSD
ncbi:NF-kappa-B inhibitor alpha-like [Ruditapes philippinarum]|uniref:NF-kappa-B inhibitor alpha-like n=1 Tax=Ruditapes philippinarum TaxID=129788 RepID=UPI00295ACE9D|nr:NF-kappa-B inhibitor alpha-like [Ruditapes philippinarum]